MHFKMIKRNLMLYFRDYVSVLFSLLSVMIVIGLYILFLAELQIDNVQAIVGNLVNDKDISYLINSSILAGLLSIISVTSTLGALATMINDKEKKIIKDFKSAPVKTGMYSTSIVISSCIVGILMSVISLVCYSIYIYVSTGYVFTSTQFIQAIALILVSVIASSAIMAFIVSLLKSNSSYSAASTVIGTLIGFITGVYVPMGVLPEGVQTFIKILPFGHVASLFRKVLSTSAIEKVFSGAPDGTISEYRLLYGVDYKFNDKIITVSQSLIVILVFTVILFILFVFNYKRKKKEI